MKEQKNPTRTDKSEDVLRNLADIYAGEAEAMPDEDPAGSVLLPLLEDRVARGERHYGVRLMTHNGRDAVRDALEEALDLILYLHQISLERHDPDAVSMRIRAEEIALDLVAMKGGET